MKTYLDNLISEKGLDINTTFDVQGNSGLNMIPLGVIIEHILITSPKEQHAIKLTLIKIDFHNGDVMHFFKHLAGAIAQ